MGRCSCPVDAINTFDRRNVQTFRVSRVVRPANRAPNSAMRDLNKKPSFQSVFAPGKFESQLMDVDHTPTPMVDDEGMELIDPFCMKDKPQKVRFEDIMLAAIKIKSGIIRTPCVKSRLSDTGMDLYMKKDFLQITGSFKERGARNALLYLNDEQKRTGVISASLGNHALALCYHGKELQIPVTVVMPVVAPIMKITACRQYGANVIVDGNDMGEAKKIALTQAKEKGLVYINGGSF